MRVAVSDNALPIDDVIEDVVAAVSRGNAVLEAPPGAGKTTRVPPALLDCIEGEILVAQPRRLAARMAARRVAEQLGERLGERVGYQVRFDDKTGPNTRIRFVTAGILARRLASDPSLRGVGAVILDEFHERHLQSDMALALIRAAQRQNRRDLRLLAMSATLDAEPVARFLNDCPRIASEGRRFPVAVDFAAQPDDRPLAGRVATALRQLDRDGLDGDVLVFLPGMGEIRRTESACAELVARLDMMSVVLHGDLPPDEQDRAVRPQSRRRLILSTNVAETSVTIAGVVAVIDSGVANVASHSPWSGLPTLRVRPVSKASAEQRAGRAGRTRPGRCVRLFTRHDYEARPDNETPAIAREDLAELALQVCAAGASGLDALDWLDAPPHAAAEAAHTLLTRLGAVAHGRLTDIGRAMVGVPAHPRLARVVVEGAALGVAREASLCAAMLSERDVRERDDRGTAEADELVDRLGRLARRKFDSGAARSAGLLARPARSIDRVARQLARAAGRPGPRPDDPDEAFARAVVAGFPDRVGKRRRSGERELVLSGGGAVQLSDAHVGGDADLFAVPGAEEVRGRRVARVVCAIEPELLIDVAADALTEETDVEYRADDDRVWITSRLRYDGVTLDETRRPPNAEELEAVASALVAAAAATPGGVRGLFDADMLGNWENRLDTLAEHRPELGLSAPDDDELTRAAGEAAYGLKTLGELRKTDWEQVLVQRLDAEARRALERLAPVRVELLSGRSVRVHYERDRPPWIESRLQDFFGMAQTPTVAGGAVPLVVHLLAPNQRAVQVTTDLAGFWERHYPTLKKQLERRYPKHAWPDDPTVAQPGMRRRKKR